ncbi:methyl-accepting chemotaxis protein [Saccharospirillum salsuginis]|uniref:Methyl-accepting chemotaxis protein n=1 Tax=Saccharospirillum salsuginis TaxID=418750 RepID=A0A918K0Y1_9GAMM|nr:methyl-accepting chemotaxis protein [Saccharospirillum salsuginis]GGX40672.1 methyl-accepting chemotaxis protein [Saccharospirillum salsuginis]
MLSSLKLKTLINLYGAFLLLAMVGIGGFALYQIQQLGSRTAVLVEEDVPITLAMEDLLNLYQRQETLYQQAFAYAWKDNYSSEADVNAAYQSFSEVNEQYFRRLDEFEALLNTCLASAGDGERGQLCQSMLEQVPDLKTGHAAYLEQAEKVMAQLRDLEPKQADYMSNRAQAEVDLMKEQLKAMETLGMQAVTSASTAVRSAQNWTQQVVLSVIVAILVLSLILSWVILRHFAHSIHRAVYLTEELATGDLTRTRVVTTKGRSEVGQVIRGIVGMVERIRDVIRQIDQLAIDNDQAVQRLSDVTDSLRRSSDHQNDAVTTIDQSLASANDIVGQSTDLTHRLVHSMDAAYTTAGELAETGRTASDIIEHAQTDVNQAQTRILELDETCHNIESIIEVIQGISEQTNLLALNAAIEAARAGEQGRGFAVVADEVRSLAQRTRASTEEIEGMITTLMTKVRAAVDGIQRGQQQIQQASTHMTSMSDQLVTMREGSNTLRGDVDAIEQATESLVSVFEQMRSISATVGSASQQVGEDAKACYHAGQQIAGSASRLREQVSVFKVE